MSGEDDDAGDEDDQKQSRCGSQPAPVAVQVSPLALVHGAPFDVVELTFILYN